jgi:hypothetical protein
MAKSSGRSVNRSASNGKFVTKPTVARSPGKTVTQHVGGKKTGQTVNRSAGTGRFVTEAAAKRNPGGTVTEKH